jgi:hypothetical protein
LEFKGKAWFGEREVLVPRPGFEFAENMSSSGIMSHCLEDKEKIES